MKIIFLDFDGVIVTAHDRYTKGDPFCVSQLNYIVQETGAKLVVSSAWRLGETTESLGTLLKSWGVHGEVIGRTDSLDVKRGFEIQKWLEDNGGCERFVILDDDTDMAHLINHLVKCHPHHGMGEEQAAEAVEMLNKSVVQTFDWVAHMRNNILINEEP